MVSSIVPGSTVRWAARLLGVEAQATPAPSAMVEIASTLPLRSEVLSFYLRPPSAVAGALISDIPFPDGAAAMLIVRADELIAPRGGTILQPGDHVFVFCHPRDRATIELLFGAVDA